MRKEVGESREDFGRRLFWRECVGRMSGSMAMPFSRVWRRLRKKNILLDFVSALPSFDAFSSFAFRPALLKLYLLAI